MSRTCDNSYCNNNPRRKYDPNDYDSVMGFLCSPCEDALREEEEEEKERERAEEEEEEKERERAEAEVDQEIIRLEVQQEEGC